MAGGTVADPAVETRAMVAEAIQVLHNQHLSVQLRRRQLMKLARSKLDLARMAQDSLGSHWNELTADQRRQFVPLFEGFIEDAYLDHIQHYANLSIDVAAEQFASSDYARVDAQVIQPGQETIPITFLLERRGNSWAVYDVAVEDVSMVENYRAQFDRVIRVHGVAQLLSDLRAKQAALGALLGESHASG